MAFSGALTLTDLNDFITPSQACIKPIETTNAPKYDPKAEAATQIHIDANGEYYEVEINNSAKTSTAQSKKLEKAEISLNDCLACSGCITSAESVLITMQSHVEVTNFLQSNPPPSSPEHKIPILSISPQALASLAATINVASTSTAPSTPPASIREILDRIRAFATVELGFSNVFDTTFARHIALQEHILEFEERVAAAKSGKEGSLPMLASACPGWVCYAEKAHAEMLPFISTTKSPQQVMGSLVKEWIGKKLGKSPEQMYHVTVMPCYDKKLEASRQDFYNEQYRTRDVDCVITTGELELLIKERGWDLTISRHPPPETQIKLPDLLIHSGSSSGGWLQSIIEHVQERERRSGRTSSVRTKTIRTADYEDVMVETITEDGRPEIVFKGSKCYGFRNLQNVVRKVAKESGLKGPGPIRATGGRTSGGAAAVLRARRIKKEQEAGSTPVLGEDRPYDYVEVMACPAGCVNGGGQARRPVSNKSSSAEEAINLVNGDTAGMGSRWGDREWVKTVDELYWSHSFDEGALFEANKLSGSIIEGLGKLEEDGRRRMLRTQYHTVISDVVGLNVKW
ncbi:Cytosolic Fe-S cluster assembly factor nar1 [Serendipita sp. 396]|nr:Cytosolic Fe-S cluster assembly factor nar1 [Serendipita sp. 396]KAG8789075.1 Cytosolic Fe-S cluster assembly factor nar1 [Serendipita sp. 397]